MRVLHLGDMLCATPALRALRHALPSAKITLMGLPWAELLPKRFPRYIDAFLHMPGYPGFPEQRFQPEAFLSFLEESQHRRFDIAIQMHGDGRNSNALLAMLGARLTFGFYRAGQYCPDPNRFMPYPETIPEPLRLLELMEFLGATPQGEHLEFPLFPEDFTEAEALIQPERLSQYRYVCVHPGSREPARRWSPEGFAKVADTLAAEGLTIVLTGSDEDGDATHEVAQMMRAPSIDLCGRTSLGSLGVLLSRSALLVCNDTGVSHMGAALRTPSVIAFVSSDVERWAPLDRERHHPVGQNGAPPSSDEVIREAKPMLAAKALAKRG